MGRLAAPATILKESLKGTGRPGMGCDGGDIERQPPGGLRWKKARPPNYEGRATRPAYSRGVTPMGEACLWISSRVMPLPNASITSVMYR